MMNLKSKFKRLLSDALSLSLIHIYMKYKGFFVKITPDNYLPREDVYKRQPLGRGIRQ